MNDRGDDDALSNGFSSIRPLLIVKNSTILHTFDVSAFGNGKGFPEYSQMYHDVYCK